jgi:hypothetical protein
MSARLLVAGRHHAAFNRGHLMAEIEGEARHVAECADLLAAIFRSDGGTGIFEQVKPVPVLQGLQFLHAMRDSEYLNE